MFKLDIFCLSAIFSALISPTMAGKQELQAVVQGNGLFTKQLYNILSKEEGNVLFSPISAHAVLAMAYQGAKGATLEAFTKALNVPDSKTAAEGYSDVLGHLNDAPDIQLLMANRLYVMQGGSLKPAFKEIVQKKFLSDVESVNFGDGAKTAGIINAWVEEKTKNKIKDLIKPGDLDALTRLVLVNAIYFKGNWASKFSPNATKTDKFYLNENDSIDVQMMSNKDEYFYKEDAELDAKILEMPYTNRDVSMIIILPNQRNGISALEEKLANVDLTKITKNMRKPEVIVKLPKFKIETTIELNEPLTKMGLEIIFKNGQADFSEMLESPEPLYVSKVVQKAFIEVNEEGTEAAAATELEMTWRTARIEHETEEFRVDHPFIFLIRAKQKLSPRRRMKVSPLLFIGKLKFPFH